MITGIAVLLGVTILISGCKLETETPRMCEVKENSITGNNRRVICFCSAETYSLGTTYSYAGKIGNNGVKLIVLIQTVNVIEPVRANELTEMLKSLESSNLLGNSVKIDVDKALTSFHVNDYMVSTLQDDVKVSS